ncbi:MAG: DHA2 family efflux MFS transporter permease subunit [Chlamydiae bacterium]|nr:DHA2 family efflux MFS transporter permease subunit [Chlamydiota bacterium]
MEDTVELSPVNRFVATLALILAAFLFVLDYTIANVAVPYIAGGLAAGVSEGTYVITSFAVGNAVFVPMTAFFSKRFGMIRTLSISIFLFTLFSLFCGAAPTLFSLTLFRFLQGASAGPLIPLSQGLLVLVQPKKRIQLILAIYAMVVLIAPVFGPIVGGYFCIYWDWRWIFYINLPVGLFCTTAIYLILKPLNKVDTTARVDYIGFTFLFIGMTALQIFLDKGQEWDWFGSQRIWICFILAFLGIFYLLLWSMLGKDRLIELSLLRIRNFFLANIIVFFSYSMYFGSIVLIPLWLQTEMGYNALAAGIAVAPIGLGSILVSLTVAKIITKIGPIPPMLIGFLIIALSNEYVRYFPAQIDRYHIMTSRFILGIGIGFWVTPMMNMAALALPKEKIASGLGIFHLVRGISGGIGASLYPTLYLRRQIHQHENLVSNISEYSEISREYIGQIGSLDLADKLIDKQASVIALNEVFHLMAIVIFILTLVLLITFKKEDKRQVDSDKVLVAD